MDRVIRTLTPGMLIDRDQILHRRHLGRQDHAIVLGHAESLRARRRREQRRLHHRFARHRAARRAGLAQGDVLVHQFCQ